MDPKTNLSDFERVKKLVNSKKAIVTPESKIKSTQQKLENKGFIEKIMERYESKGYSRRGGGLYNLYI